MHSCPHCQTVNGSELRWCHKCGASIIHEPALAAGGSFGHDFFRCYGAAIHRRHRRLNLQMALVISTLIHLIMFGFIV